MAIRRGDVTDIAWLEMNCLITYQQEDMLVYVTTTSEISVLTCHKPNLGICRPGNRFVKVWEVQYFE